MIDLNVKIPDGFYDSDERSGFVVGDKLKEVWAVELDLLKVLDDVCQKNGLKYCAGAGTLLGAVRHKGFIPWDDDMDLYMLREDYDRLIKLADEFPKPYFLQCAYTESNLVRAHAKLRNSNTTGCIENDRYRESNKGIFIDIFPLDGVQDSDYIQRIINYFFEKTWNAFNYYHANRSAHGLKHIVEKMTGYLISKALSLDKQNKIITLYENNLRKYSKEGITMWGNRTKVFMCPKSRRPLSDWKDLIDVEFEFLTIPIPKNYDQILRQQYGDYMKIPQNIGENMHGELIISTSCPYTEYQF